jgi:hypothetical protein
MNNREETEIQNRIRLECSDIAILFRINVYEGKTESGQYIKSAIKGYSDLSGYRKSDGKAVFIEVKKPGGKIRPEQINFIKIARQYGCLSGFAYSVEDARNIILDTNNNK